MNTILSSTAPPTSSAASTANDDAPALTHLCAAANQCPPMLDAARDTPLLPETTYAAPNVFQAVVAPDFNPGCREQGRVGPRMKISSKG